MGSIWVKEFTGGLDTRRMPVTTSGGVLVKAENGHISRGGEFEKRAAFVPTYDLPAGTIGMAQTFTGGIYVFGHQATPVGIPAGVTYQRLQHEDGTTALSRVLSYDLYAGKLYVVGKFADGSIFHFYDGVRVTDWYDGLARASLTITAGSVSNSVAASASFEVLSGTDDPANGVGSITVDGVAISGSVQSLGDNAATAEAIADSINSSTSVPDYTATTMGQTVIITAVTAGPAINGKAVITVVNGDCTLGNFQNFAGGADNVASQLTDLKINGVSIISAPVLWATSNEATATAIAAAINSYTSVPDYTATATGAEIDIVAALPGANANGRAVTTVTTAGLGVSPSSGLVMAGGSDDVPDPGTFVKTVGSKMYSVSESVTFFSGIDAPTKWTTDNVGAGFIDMAKQSSGMEQLTALGEYQTYLAIFAERVILIEYVDPDPTLNRKVQVLKNTGTRSGQSVTQFGDNDIFYLDESGLRSLRARDASNAAATSDIGVPIDTLIVEKLTTLTDTERQNIFGLIEPTTGRFWLVVKDVIYVFSFFNGAKVSAWTTYVPGYEDEEDGIVNFDVSAAVVYNRRVYVRSGDTVFVYGGLGANATYDATVAEAWLPYLDANAPTQTKEWQGLDAALEGEWEVRYAMQPTNETATDKIATLFETTYNQDRVPSMGASTHISPRFKSKGSGPARVSAVVISYEGDQIEG